MSPKASPVRRSAGLLTQSSLSLDRLFASDF